MNRSDVGMVCVMFLLFSLACGPQPQTPSGKKCTPPAGGIAVACKKNGETCKENWECDSGNCAAVQGGGNICGPKKKTDPNKKANGQACTADAECQSGKCVAGAFGKTCGKGTDPNKKANGQACTADAECQSGKCVAGATGKVCGSPTTRKADGQACTADAECQSGKCVAGATGKVCGTPTTRKATGQPCTKPEECQGGFCAQPPQAASYCTQKCGTCPTGFQCVDTGQGYNLCIPGTTPTKKAIGQPCTKHDECQGGICATSPQGQTFCTQKCGTCPTGYKCVPTQQGVNICAPNTGTQARCTSTELQKANACLGNCTPGDTTCQSNCFQTHLSQNCYTCLQELTVCGNNNGCDPSQNANCCAAKRVECMGS